MAKIRLGTDEIQYITLFETLTGASVKDCVQEEDTISFLVKKGDMGLAIGKGGANIERVKKAIGKNAIIMEFSEEAAEFMKNLFLPVRIKHLRFQTDAEGKIAILEVHKNDYKKIIGPNGIRIKIAKKLAERHFSVGDIKIKSVY